MDVVDLIVNDSTMHMFRFYLNVLTTYFFIKMSQSELQALQICLHPINNLWIKNEKTFLQFRNSDPLKNVARKDINLKWK